MSVPNGSGLRREEGGTILESDGAATSGRGGRKNRHLLRVERSEGSPLRLTAEERERAANLFEEVAAQLTSGQ